MIVKITGAPDQAGRTSTEQVIDEVAKVRFGNEGSVHFVSVQCRSGTWERHDLPGNAFVMNDDGQTIDKFINPSAR
jgi:hypothetical protein